MLQDSALKVFRTLPRLEGVPFGSDMGLWNTVGNVTTFMYGAGSHTTAHTPNESIDLNQLTLTYETLLHFSASLLSHSSLIRTYRTPHPSASAQSDAWTVNGSEEKGRALGEGDEEEVLGRDAEIKYLTEEIARIERLVLDAETQSSPSGGVDEGSSSAISSSSSSWVSIWWDLLSF